MKFHAFWFWNKTGRDINRKTLKHYYCTTPGWNIWKKWGANCKVIPELLDRWSDPLSMEFDNCELPICKSSASCWKVSEIEYYKLFFNNFLTIKFDKIDFFLLSHKHSIARAKQRINQFVKQMCNEIYF